MALHFDSEVAADHWHISDHCISGRKAIVAISAMISWPLQPDEHFRRLAAAPRRGQGSVTSQCAATSSDLGIAAAMPRLASR